MKVLALTKHGPLGASSRVRTLQYLPSLKANGIDVTVCPLLDDQYLARRYAGRRAKISTLIAAYAGRLGALVGAHRYDLVWIEKQLLPWVPALVEGTILRRTRYVLDFDDAVFHGYDQHPNPLIRLVYGAKIDRLIRGATMIVAGNAYLADRARRAGARRIEIMPSVIELGRYGPVQPLPDGEFTVGWIGSPGSERLLETLREVLTEVARSPNTRLVLVGASDRALSGIPHETWAWSDATEVESMRRFHIGIMPLSDTPWERGKCGFKLIQCMGVGRAVVASPIGVNSEIVDHGKSGLLASSPAEWRDAFESMRSDPTRTAAMGLVGRRRVDERYSLETAGPRLAELLRSIEAA